MCAVIPPADLLMRWMAITNMIVLRGVDVIDGWMCRASAPQELNGPILEISEYMLAKA